MAKQTSLFGKISGKLGAVVFSTSGGETISREYNPNVANPNTQAQIDQRARMKLMSQLSAVLDPVIVMKKEGLISKRNKFVQRNFGSCYASNGEAQVSYENLQLTSGNAALPQIVFDREQATGIATLSLAENAGQAVSRVCYIIYKKTAQGNLQFVNSEVATNAGAGGTFPWIIGELAADNYVFYAYGMKDLSAQATAQYGNLQVTTANDLAKLYASRQLSTADYQFTQTRGATSNDGSPIEPTPEGKVRVYATASGPGTATGTGLYDVGSNVTVVATPTGTAIFLGWYYNGSNLRVSTERSYTFVALELTDLVARFETDTI